AVRGPRAARHRVQAARVALRGVVLARRSAGHRHALLSRPSAPRAARAAHHARSGGRRPAAAAANPAARGRARARQRLPAAPARALAAGLRPRLASLSRALPGEGRQPAPSASPRKLARNRQIRRGLADELLRRAFTSERPRRRALRAATLLRAEQRRLGAAVARALKIERYSVKQVLGMLIERCERLGLYVHGNRRDARRYSRWMLERLAGLYSQGETPHLPLCGKCEPRPSCTR